MRALPLVLTLALLVPLFPAETDLAAEAEKQLFASRYPAAIDAYSRLVQENPASGFAHDRLVRSLLAAHETERAYKAVEEAVKLTTDPAPLLTAQGRVAFRKGQLADAESFFRKAAADPKYADAAVGISEIYSAVSRFASAQRIMRAAWSLNPLDPNIMLAGQGPQSDADHEAALKRALALLDPASERARSLRAHIARDAAMHGRKRKLISPVQPAKIKVIRLLDGPRRALGLGVEVRLNDKTVVRLRLDSGAGGISLSPQAAKRAQLEELGRESTEARGLGDKFTNDSFAYLAEHLTIGPLEWENFPVSVFNGVRSADTDGLIGTDVFSRFIVAMDFPASEMSLEPHQAASGPEDTIEAAATPSGFTKVFRFGHLLLIPTSINDGPNKLFLLDSGAMVNLVDIHAAEASTKVRSQERLVLSGVQGKVKDVRSADKGSIAFAGFRQDNTDLTAVDLHRLSDDTGVEVSGIIGMQVFWQLKMTIDYGTGSVKLERSKSSPR